MNRCGKSRWAWDYSGGGGDVVGAEHAKGANWEEERDDNRDYKMRGNSGTVMWWKGKHDTPFAPLRQDAEWTTSTGIWRWKLALNVMCIKYTSENGLCPTYLYNEPSSEI